MDIETPYQKTEREAVERRECRKCQFCAWEKDYGPYCQHHTATTKVSPMGASFETMERLGLCGGADKKLWRLRNART